MACNAYNHPLNCRCGWGGVNYGSGIRSWEIKQAHEYERAEAEKQKRAHDLKPFVTPNARCPVCGAEVWFYSSPDGGRVYFDDLGWPWPKHPCTDNRTSDPRLSPFLALKGLSGEAADARQRAWQTSGDRPIIRWIHSETLASVDILQTRRRSLVELAEPQAFTYLTWLAVVEIDSRLPAFLREGSGGAEIHTLRWTGTTFEPRVIGATIG